MKKIFNLKSVLCTIMFAICLTCCIVAVNSTNSKKTFARSAAIGSCYLQTDSRWASISANGGSLGPDGCAIFSLINGINTYQTITDVKGTATTIMNHAASYGYFGSDGTYVNSYLGLFEEISTPYNTFGGYHYYNCAVGNYSDLDVLKDHVSKNKNFAVINVDYNHYGESANHAMAVVDYNYSTDQFTVHDSATGSTYYMSSNYLINTRRIDGYSLFRVDANAAPTIKDNRVLKAPTMGSVDTTSNYYITDSNFANRKIIVTNTDSDYSIDYMQASTHMDLEATFKITGKKSSEEYGKFGITLLDNSGNGLWVFADARGTSGGTTASSVTGTSINIVKKDNNGWQWSTDRVLKSDAFSSSTAFSIRLLRNGLRLEIFIDDQYVGFVNTGDYGIDMDEVATASIFGWSILLEVTNFSCTPIQETISIDGDFSDWKNAGWNKFKNSFYQKVTDINDKSKYANFYFKKTEKGIYIYAIAKHHVNTTGSNDWWKNTNFEIHIDGPNSYFRQYYANHKIVRGFDNFYFNTTGTSGNYTTVLEGFISLKNTDYKHITKLDTIGFAFKVENEAGTNDTIQISSDSSPTSFWAPSGIHPSKTYIGTSYAQHEKINVDTVATPLKTYFKPLSQQTNTNHASINGEELVFDTAQDNSFYLYEYQQLDGAKVNATFKITGKLNEETYGKIGLKFVNSYGNGFYFFADAQGSTGTSVSSITGTTFGVVKFTNGNAEWNSNLTINPISHSSAKFSANTAFTMSVRYNKTDRLFDLMVNNVTVASISSQSYGAVGGTTDYTPCPCIYSNQVSAIITNYGLEKTAIDGLVTDSNLDDWKALSNWNSINNLKVGVYDDNNSNKGATFYYNLTKNGLHIALQANHSLHPNGNWAEWWNNTNVEMFIGKSSSATQFYASEIYTQGFNYYSFVTKYNSSLGLYTTIFEGYISNNTLYNVCNYDGEEISLGFAFKASNSNDKVDNITVNGSTTSYWCVGNLDPRLINTTAKLAHSCEYDTTTYQTDGTYHWHLCKTCSAPSEKVKHSYTVKNQKHLASEATCTQKAKYYFTCTCGHVGSTTYEYGSYLDHNYVWENEIPATCTTNGTKGHYHCDGCNKNFDAEYNEITDLTITGGHNYGTWIAEIPAKPGVPGTVGHYHCDGCNQNFDSNKQVITDLVIPALPIASSSSSAPSSSASTKPSTTSSTTSQKPSSSSSSSKPSSSKSSSSSSSKEVISSSSSSSKPSSSKAPSTTTSTTSQKPSSSSQTPSSSNQPISSSVFTPTNSQPPKFGCGGNILGITPILALATICFAIIVIKRKAK